MYRLIGILMLTAFVASCSKNNTWPESDSLKVALTSTDVLERYAALQEYFEAHDKGETDPDDLRRMHEWIKAHSFPNEIENCSPEFAALWIIGHCKYTGAVPTLAENLMVYEPVYLSDGETSEFDRFPFARALSRMGDDAAPPLRKLIAKYPLDSVQLRIACSTLQLAVGCENARLIIADDLPAFDQTRRERVTELLKKHPRESEEHRRRKLRAGIDDICI